MTGSGGNEKRGGHQEPSPSWPGEALEEGMKSPASIGMPFDVAKPNKTEACRNGTIPPVPPFSFGWHQFQTRVRWTPAIAATFEGPPRSLIMVDAGSMDRKVSKFETSCNSECLEFVDRHLSRFSLQDHHEAR